ncbi:hypothetical protein ACFQHV_22740 [Promicromonospora thailandica]|uniref:DUF2269 domain-containing protein n=1 Tax=Promicromonospora thailandica TaxID=765201 RepID=A0A9X2FYD4_9MICO|nr:hypothetical protein [Promicromonospora thailandica]MCP2263444.1 hypothetical protein [Promicromonospora thailandica]BFF19389.1 hypothetical protein GCM10025730_29100 [Promicromonospora thailandica]
MANLPPPLRKAVLTVHVVSAGAWIGIDVLVAVLAALALGDGPDAVRGLALRALAAFVVPPMLTAALVCLATGVLLGLATRWGLVRYWWVAVKLVTTLVLCTLIVVLLRPGMADVGAAGTAVEAGQVPAADVSFLAYPPAVSLTALAVATVLSVYKPWGRVRPGRAAPAGTARGKSRAVPVPARR